MPQTVQINTTTASADTIKRYKEARARRDHYAKRNLKRYYADPVAFAHDCFKWEDGRELRPYQEEALALLGENGKLAVRGPHGLGKTTSEAIAILWFALTRSAAGVDWKCLTTAGAWGQLKHYLWPEVHKWAARLNWQVLGREPFSGRELLTMDLHLPHGSAFARASTKVEYMEGAHADSVLVVFDEAKAIPVDIFNALQGVFSGGVGTEAFGMACSTPGEPQGWFHDICVQKPGMRTWKPRHVTKDEVIASGAMSYEWDEEHKLMWGEQSALYANRVLGEFHAADEDGVIPLSWIEAANTRWKEHAGTGGCSRIGVDVARTGDDKTIIALRDEWRINELREYFHASTMETAGNVAGIQSKYPRAVAAVDTDGLGAGVTDRLAEMGLPVYAFHAGAKTDKRDKTGELGFVNVRSAAWWNLREILDPRYELNVELPPDDELLGELTAPKWKVESGGRISVERKVDIKKRLQRSTDRADAIMHAFWEERKKRKAAMYYGGIGEDAA